MTATATWTGSQAAYSGTQLGGYTTTTATSDSTWYAWNQQQWGASTGTTSITLSASVSDATWQVWVGQSGLGQQRPLTPEEVRQNARWAEQARQAREQADADAKRVKAKADAERERAMELLREHLDEEQREQLEAKGEFEVESQNGNRYAIKKGYAGNVFRLDAKRKRVTQYCIHPVDLVPDGDAMLAQMCWIKWNEEQFLKVANATRLAA